MVVTSLILVGLVGLAGALGALARYLLGRFIGARIKSAFPLGTFLINITGSFLIGLVFTLAGQKLISPAIQLILATGFLGGYTTFSTAAWEQVQLMKAGSNILGLFYLLGSMLCGLVAVAAGLAIGRFV